MLKPSTLAICESCTYAFIFVFNTFVTSVAFIAALPAPEMPSTITIGVYSPVVISSDVISFPALFAINVSVK